MAKPDTRRLDRALQDTEKKLEAVRRRELWPLEGRERRAILSAATSGCIRVARARSTGHADRQIDTTWESAETRLNAEIAALKTERQRIVREAAATKAAKKSSGWW